MNKWVRGVLIYMSVGAVFVIAVTIIGYFATR